MEKPIIVLFCGKAGVGKTTSARLATKLCNKKCSVFSFASSVKNCARDYFYWDGNKDEYGRKLLQLVGGFGREINPDLWVIHAKNSIKNFSPAFAFIDDCRFPNEINKMKGFFKTYTVRIEASDREILKGTPAYDDLSEVSLPSGENELYDFVIDNSGTLEELETNVKDIINKILEMEK